MLGRNDAVVTADRDLTLMRIFDAPRELVFAAWTEPHHIARWKGPHGFTSTVDKFDLRPGGGFRFCLHAPDGAEHWQRGSFREVTPPQRLVMTHRWERDDGTLSPETIVTVTFAAIGNKTKMVFHQAFFETQAARDGHEDGWRQSFERLAAHLVASRSISSASEA
jgi:uncharacterized protein YndB with AHSA1/START domain